VVGGGTITYDDVAPNHTFKNCLHTHQKLTIGQVAHQSYAVASGVHGATDYAFCFGGLNGTYCSAPAKASIVEVTEEMRQEAWNAMYPDINTGLGLIVSALELRDFVKLFHTAGRLLNFLEKQAGLRRFRGTYADVISDGTLAWSYGIRPMLSDIAGLASLLFDFHRTLTNFAAKGKVPMPYHYRKLVADGETFVADVAAGYVYDGETSKYNATCLLTYDYNVPDLNKLQRIMGMRITPSLVWDAIPWSFVVDYILGIGKFLEALDHDPNVHVNVLDYCDTIKTTSYRREYRNFNSSSPIAYAGQTCNASIGIVPSTVYSFDDIRYNRVVGAPNTGINLLTPHWELPQLRELVLMFLLARGVV
jgi:hypothetical protein